VPDTAKPDRIGEGGAARRRVGYNAHMKRRFLLTASATLLALAQLSCAVGSLVPEPHSMPAARASLRPVAGGTGT